MDKLSQDARGQTVDAAKGGFDFSPTLKPETAPALDIVYNMQAPGRAPGNWVYWARMGVILFCAAFWIAVAVLLIRFLF